MEKTTTLFLALALSAFPPLWADAPDSLETPEAGPPITLEQAQARALQQSPEIAASTSAVRAADGAWRQARALPNPELSIDFDGFGGDIPEQTEAQTLYSVEQVVETAGKRKSRSLERQLARTVAEGDAEIKHREVLVEVRRRFIRVLGLQERTRILEEALRTAEAVQRTVHDLVVAGEVSPIEELKVEADASLARIDLRTARSDLAVARQELAQTWGGRKPDFGPAVGDLAVRVTIPSFSDMQSQIASLPDIARVEADVARLETALDGEKRKRIPDLALSAGLQEYRAFDEHSFVAGVKIPLPILDRNAGAIAEASGRLEQGRHERAAAEARVISALAAAHERLSAAAHEVEALRDTVLPKARQVLEGVAEGYRRGKFRLLELLDARRSLEAAELRYNDALINFSLAGADLERWTGTSGPGASGGTR